MSELRRLRPPAVAGSFYPGDAAALRSAIERSLADARPADADAPVPKALVVPHAGYVYSGPVAATGFARLLAGRRTIRRVVLLGPSHRVPVRGLGLSGADLWRTPLGDVTVDHDDDQALLDLSAVVVDDAAHAPEHSLEVQVPFLQSVLDEFRLVPVIVGDASAHEVASVLNLLWGGPETVVVISTDLSHYHPHQDAVRLDARTAAAIVACDRAAVGDRDACGARPLRGLLAAAVERDLAVEPLDLRTSGDTAGDTRSVVGYGTFALT